METLWTFFGKAAKGGSQFQYMSDLHLETRLEYRKFELPAVAPYLILAGDIGNLTDYVDYLAFLEAQVANFQLVFLVLGNHEFYGVDHATGIERAKKLELEPSLNGKLILLNQRRWDDPKSQVTILGCTLWSHIPDASADAIRNFIPDFKQSERWAGISNWGVENHNETHRADLAWLRGQVSQIQKVQPQRNILIATHYAPVMRGTSKPEHEGSAISPAFSTDILMVEEDWKGVGWWIYGHTHYITEFVHKEVIVTANARGYPRENITVEQAKSQKTRRHAFDIKKVLTVS